MRYTPARTRQESAYTLLLPKSGIMTLHPGFRLEENKNSPPGPKGKSMEKLAQNIQEAFLNNARKDKIFLTIYLMSGVKLSGRIKSFDKYSVVLETNNQEQLIFKHAISTVVVARAPHLERSSPVSAQTAAPLVPASNTQQG